MVFSLATAVLGLAVVAFVVPAEAKDQLIDWSFGMAQGGTKVDMLQCQQITFDWMGGGFHDVYEFPDEASYDSCDFSNAVELTPASATGIFTISGEDTLDVTKRWFGCQVGSHCESGNMKIALKVRPLFTNKFEESECLGGTVDITKSEPTIKACRKRCKRRRGCFAIQYESKTQKCSVYTQVPREGRANSDVQCEVASTSCQATEPTPAPQCDVEVRVGCKLSSDGKTECTDIPTPTNEAACRVLVNYTYYVKHNGPTGARLQSITRTREGAHFGGDERAYGTGSVGFEIEDFVLDTWEEDFVDLCQPDTYTTNLEAKTTLASAGLTCVESDQYVNVVDPVVSPPSPAPTCSMNVEVTCEDDLDGTECASIEIPPGSADADCFRTIKYGYRFHNVGDGTATIKSILRTRPGAVMHSPVYDFAQEFPTDFDLPRLNQVTLTELPTYNFCNPATYTTTFTLSAMCDGMTNEDFTDVYEFEVV